MKSADLPLFILFVFLRTTQHVSYTSNVNMLRFMPHTKIFGNISTSEKIQWVMCECCCEYFSFGFRFVLFLVPFGMEIDSWSSLLCSGVDPIYGSNAPKWISYKLLEIVWLLWSVINICLCVCVFFWIWFVLFVYVSVWVCRWVNVNVFGLSLSANLVVLNSTR